MNDTTVNAREVTLHNGVTMPTLAFGCAFGDWVGSTEFQGFLPEQAWRAVSLALDNGYRAFDGARAYGTERIVGALLGQRFASGQLTRDELFVTTKLAHPVAPPHINISHRRTWDSDKVDDIAQKVRDDMVETLDDLGLGYVDLLLMHWPGGFGQHTSKNPDFPRKARATIWQAFCELADKDAARAVGVSNFTIAHLRQLMEDVPEPERRPTILGASSLYEQSENDSGGRAKNEKCFFKNRYTVLVDPSSTGCHHDKSCAKHPRLQPQDTGQHYYSGYG